MKLLQIINNYCESMHMLTYSLSHGNNIIFFIAWSVLIICYPNLNRRALYTNINVYL